MAKRNLLHHWPALLLGLVVATIFTAVLISFEVKETDHAIVMRFGRPKLDEAGKVKDYEPGIHLKWPYPVETVWRHDNRLQCYELTKGQVEQIQTADDFQIVVTTYVLWRVGDPAQFLRAVNTTKEAETKLDAVVRNSRNSILGQHALTSLINIDPSKVKITDIEKEILEDLKPVAMQKYGIEVSYMGIKHLGFPEKVSSKVFERMKAERQRKSEQYRAEGKRDADQIRAKADLQAEETLTLARAEATRIRGDGDRKAAEFYAVFRQNPELASFLRKLDSLRQTLSEKTTLVLDTNTPPYDLLRPDATNLLNQAGKEQAQEGNTK